MTRTINTFLENNDISLKEILYKLTFPSIGKLVAITGLGLIGVPLIEVIVLAILNYIGISTELSNNPVLGFGLVILGLGYEFFIYNSDKNKSKSILIDLESNANLFNNFHIKEALTNLDKLIQKADRNNNKLMFKLYLQKSEFMLKLNRSEDFKDNIHLIDKKYSKLAKSGNEKYLRLKLIYFSLIKNKNQFWELAQELSINQGIEKEYYYLIYYNNTKEFQEIKQIINKKKYTPEKVDKNIALVLGHFYSTLAYSRDEAFNNNYDLMTKFYDNYIINSDNLNELELLTINMAKCLNATVLFSQYKTINKEEKEQLLNLIKFIEKNLEELNYFDNSYKNIIINNLSIYYLTNEEIEKFNTLFEDNKQIMFEQQYIYYYFVLGHDITTEEVFNIYENKNYLNFLHTYLEYLYINKNQDEVITIVEDKDLLNLDDKIKDYYNLSRVDKDIELKAIFNEYDNQEKDDLISTIVYLKASKKLNHPVDSEFLINLEKNLSSTNYLPIGFMKILIKLLFKLNSSYTLNLVIQLQKMYPYLIFDCLNKIQKRNFRTLIDFENFLSRINENLINKFQYYATIGDIYNQFFHLYKAYVYYCKAWEEKNDTELAKRILETIIRMKNCNIEIENIEIYNKIYSFLILNNIFNNIETALIGAYNHFQDKEYKEGTILFSQRLLASDLSILKEKPLDTIGDLYFKSIIETSNELEKIEENLLIIENPLLKMNFTEKRKDSFSYINYFNQVLWINHNKNSTYYINKIYEGYAKKGTLNKYNFQFKSNLEMKVFNKYYVRTSLFHFIANKLIHKSKNVKTIKHDKKDINFDEILEWVKQGGIQDQKMINHHMTNGFIPLFQLSKYNYEKLPPLMITELMYKENNTFNSGFNNPNIKAKKIISISSLFLLKYLGHLEKVLSLDNVYVQYTVLNWIEKTKEKMKNDKSAMSMSYENGSFYKHEITKEEKEGLVKVYEDLYDILINYSVANNKIVNDYKFILPYKMPFNIIKSIGHLDVYAMGYCINNNFQLITEDISSTQMYEVMEYNPIYISNIMSLLQELLEAKEFINLAYELSTLSYKNTLNEGHLNNLENIYEKENFSVLMKDKDFADFIGKMVYILNKDGYLEDFKLKYKHQYMIQGTVDNSTKLEKLKMLLNSQYNITNKK